MTKVKDITGQAQTGGFGMGATDLGVSCKMPNGKILYVFGDTFRDHVGGPDWRSPVGLVAHADTLNSVEWCHAAGSNSSYAQQLLPYAHNIWVKGKFLTTVIPSDVITIGNTIYMHVIVNNGLGNVNWTEFHRSTDNGVSWQHYGQDIAADRWNGRFQQVTFEDGGDGYIYSISTGFQRDRGIMLSRCRVRDFPNIDKFQTWGWNGRQWGWGNWPSDIIGGKFGEMSFRKIENKFVLTFFNSAAPYNIEAIIVDSPTSNFHTAPRKILVHGTSWGNEGPDSLAQAYGGYAIPGSTLENFNYVVSQWKTSDNARYHSMQFKSDLTS